jgi:thiol-disulfide isomerase/thioredoxin
VGRTKYVPFNMVNFYKLAADTKGDDMLQLLTHSIKCIFPLFIVVTIFMLSESLLSAEEEKPTTKKPEVLTIGSKAPDLDIEHWVSDGEGKFKKTTTFDKDKVYIVEFWATWCGPCISSMPHIADLQKTYADKGVQIVSVSDENLETVQKFLERKVPMSEEEKTFGELTKIYCLTTDPDGSTSKDYMRAAGQNGIPCAFVVGKTGLIEWIGHPMSIDKTLASVVDDKWDREAYAIAFKQEQEFDLAVAEIGNLYRAKKFDEAIKVTTALNTSGNVQLEEQKTQMLISLLIADNRGNEALALIDKVIASNPEDSSMLLGFKVRALLSIKGKESAALELVKSLCEDEKQPMMLKTNLVSQISTNIINGKINTPETSLEIRKIADTLLKSIKDESAIGLLVTMSALAGHTNDKKSAIAYLEKAIEVNTNPRVQTILKQRLSSIQDEPEAKDKDQSEIKKPAKKIE